MGDDGVGIMAGGWRGAGELKRAADEGADLRSRAAAGGGRGFATGRLASVSLRSGAGSDPKGVPEGTRIGRRGGGEGGDELLLDDGTGAWEVRSTITE